MMKRWKPGKPLAPPAKDSLRSSFASGGLSRFGTRYSRFGLVAYFSQTVLNWVFDKDYVLHCFELQRILHIFTTRCPIEMGFESKCSIFTGQVILIEKSKFNIADMWLIPLDRVTYIHILCSDLVIKVYIAYKLILCCMYIVITLSKY